MTKINRIAKLMENNKKLSYLLKQLYTRPANWINIQITIVEILKHDLKALEEMTGTDLLLLRRLKGDYSDLKMHGKMLIKLRTQLIKEVTKTDG